MLSVVVLVFLSPLVTSYDLAVGLNSYGTKFYEEERHANPAIWRQNENVTIVAPENEVISKVLVIDMRPEKDGDAKVVDGGERQKTVTIELKSPTVLRGYHFHIEAYAVSEEQTSEPSSTDTTEKTDFPTSDSSPVKCSTESSIAAEDTTESETTDSIREARNSVIENDNESNETAVNTEQPIMINGDATTSTDLTTQSDSSTTVAPDVQTTNSNMPDFPLTGMEGDETRHIRKIGDDLYTSTVDSLSGSFNMDGTETPNFGNVGLDNETDVNNTKSEETYDTTTMSDISTTLQNDEAFTMSPNANGKDILDFDDLLSTDGEESRFARHINTETDSTTSGDISTTEIGETTTFNPDTLNDFGNETRNSREAVYDPMNEANEYTDSPQINSQMPQFPQVIGNEDYDVSSTTVTDEQGNVTEGSGDFTTDAGYTTLAPEAATTPVYLDSLLEEQLRMSRGIVPENDTLIPDTTDASVPNYPFIDPATVIKPDVGNDYVYVPILAVISKENYPAFKGALDNVSMNVAFPNEESNTSMEENTFQTDAAEKPNESST